MFRLNPSGHSTNYFIFGVHEKYDEARRISREIEEWGAASYVIEEEDLRLHLSHHHVDEMLGPEPIFTDKLVFLEDPGVTMLRIKANDENGLKLIRKTLEGTLDHHDEVMLGDVPTFLFNDGLRLTFIDALNLINTIWREGLKMNNMSLYTGDFGCAVTINRSRQLDIFITINYQYEEYEEEHTPLYDLDIYILDLVTERRRHGIDVIQIGDSIEIYASYYSIINPRETLKMMLEWIGIHRLLRKRLPELKLDRAILAGDL